MLYIFLQPLHHRGKESIAIRFGYNKEISCKVKMVKDARWTRTHGCWYVPLTREHYTLLKAALSACSILDSAALRRYLEQRKAVQPLVKKKETISPKRAYLLQEFPLNKENLAAFTRFQQTLQINAYSQNTFRTYSTEFHCLLRLLGTVSVSTLTKANLEVYLLWLMKKEGTRRHTCILPSMS